eukprot:TRINITY_DN1215_c0_g1_i1.p1 TRINITY_DN1215_c0_g1~~TRINITY_DN1215_c0_g1_i1.p1  ORF type:complete len:674 (-),score=171.92 TRINITY_DN1215_c0_g1_i1:40-2061(-)
MARFFSNKDSESLPCRGCGQHIALTDDIKIFENRRWHRKCFKCQNCELLFVKGKVRATAVKGLPFCADCAEEATQEKCYICKRGIPDGTAITPTPLRRKVHPECFKCDVCASVIGELACNKRGNVILCISCSSKSNRELGLDGDDLARGKRRSMDASENVEFLDDLDGEALDFLDEASPSAAKNKHKMLPRMSSEDSVSKAQAQVAVSGLKFWKKNDIENNMPPAGSNVVVVNMAQTSAPKMSFLDVAKSPRAATAEPNTPSKVDDFLDEEEEETENLMTQTLPNKVDSRVFKADEQSNVARTESSAQLSSTSTFSQKAAQAASPKPSATWFKPGPQISYNQENKAKKWYKPQSKTPSANNKGDQLSSTAGSASIAKTLAGPSPAPKVESGSVKTENKEEQQKSTNASGASLMADLLPVAKGKVTNLSRSWGQVTLKSEVETQKKPTQKTEVETQKKAAEKAAAPAPVPVPVQQSKPDPARVAVLPKVTVSAEKRKSITEAPKKSVPTPKLNAVPVVEEKSVVQLVPNAAAGVGGAKKHIRNKSIGGSQSGSPATEDSNKTKQHIRKKSIEAGAPEKSLPNVPPLNLNASSRPSSTVSSPVSGKPSMADVVKRSPRFDAIPAAGTRSPGQSPQAKPMEAVAAPPAVQVKFCWQCGTKREPITAKFCFSCGNKY